MTPDIVVGVDGSDLGAHALRWAVTENRLRHVWVQAVHVWAPPSPISSVGPLTAPIDMAEFEQCAKTVLEDAIGSVPEAASNETVEPVLVRGYAPTALLDRARDAELLVVGTRGRGGFKGLLLGSVSQHCVSHAPCPVVVVPLGAPLPDASDVVVGVDGSEGSQVALQFALAEAKRRGAQLVVAHAWWTQYPASSAETLPFLSINRKEYTAHSQQLLSEMMERARAATCAVDVEVQLVPLEDAPARGLLALAETAGLLVVGTRGRGGFAGLLLGSVSQQCVQHAPCAVAVVPQR